MTTGTRCKNCGAPSAGRYCTDHDLRVPTASRLVPEPGALAEPELYVRMSRTEAFGWLMEALERCEELRQKRGWAIARMAAVTEALDQLDAYTELPPPLTRRTPSRDGESVLGRLIDQAAQHLREPYAPVGMVAICIQCSPHSWWLSAQDRDSHAAEKHPEEAR